MDASDSPYRIQNDAFDQASAATRRFRANSKLRRRKTVIFRTRFRQDQRPFAPPPKPPSGCISKTVECHACTRFLIVNYS